MFVLQHHEPPAPPVGLVFATMAMAMVAVVSLASARNLDGQFRMWESRNATWTQYWEWIPSSAKIHFFECPSLATLAVLEQIGCVQGAATMTHYWPHCVPSRQCAHHSECRSSYPALAALGLETLQPSVSPKEQAS